MEKSIQPDWSEIRNIFGNAVAEYLKEHECVIRKSKTGAFVMRSRDRHLFDDCAHLMRNLKRSKKKNSQNQQICNRNPSCTIEYVDTTIKDNLYLFENFKGDSDFAKINENFILELNESTVSPNPSTSKEHTEANNNADLNIIHREIRPKHKKINKLKSRIFKNLFKIVKDQHENCVPKFRSIVECFIRNHRAFKYSIILDIIPQDKTLIDGLLSKKQVIEFFHKVFCSVVPVSLFGNRANLKKIKRCMFFYFKASEKETFYIKDVVKSLNTNIIWLRKIKDKQSQLLVLYDIVQWFFEEFISGIVNAYLFTEKGATDRQKYFFRRWKKKFTNRNYIKEQVEKKIFSPVKAPEFISDNVPLAKLVFYTKKDGLRPILSTMASPEQKNERLMIKRILYQLYMKNYETINSKKIHQVWSSLKKLDTGSEKTSLYFVSCDILDAYGSIIQQKLLKIISDKLDKLPSQLVARWFVILDSKNSPVIQEYKDSVAPEILPLTLPPRSLCCLDTKVQNLCKVINVEQIKQKLESYIFKQLIYVYRKYYVLKQGVGQGLPMSALLCDLYYEDMLEKEFSDFMEHGHLFRYVDDFLYLTKSEDAAKRFLEKINEGIQSYNCTFKQRKTQTNLMPYNNEEFIYLGYRFNIKTFNVVPEYASISARYTTTTTRVYNNTLNVFGQRISNFESLKLCPLIMDFSINSQEVILNTIKNASILSAERCLVLLMNMFDLKNIDYKEIFKIMKGRCIQVLISEFLRMMSIDTENNLNLRNQVKELVWKSYYEVFQAKKFIRKCFLRQIKSQYITNK